MATKIYNKCILTTFYYIQHFKFYFLLYVLLQGFIDGPDSVDSLCWKQV